jgi:integrase
MAKRRGHNEGSISQRSNGSWRGQVSLPGGRMSKTFRTKREAQDWVREMLNQVDAGLSFQGANTPLGDFLQQWLTSVKPSLRGSTWIHYEGIVRNHLIPGLGEALKLKDLKPALVQEFYNRLLRRGVGVSTVRYVHVVLRIAMAYAVKLQLILEDDDPTKRVIAPRQPAKEMKFYDESQVNRLTLAAAGHRLEALFYLAVTTGMRESEILGLLWTDLDWIRKKLRISRQLAQAREKYELVELKTDYSRRELVLGDTVIQKLHERSARQQEERRFAGDRWVETGLIFTSTIGTPLDHRNL